MLRPFVFVQVGFTSKRHHAGGGQWNAHVMAGEKLTRDVDRIERISA